MIRLGLLLLCLGVAGCGARDCLYDIAHRDCHASVAVASEFPQDDAICRSYHLAPGASDYARCREAKARERRITRDETDYGFLRNPILPAVH